MPYLSTILIGLVVLAVVAFAVRCTLEGKRRAAAPAVEAAEDAPGTVMTPILPPNKYKIIPFSYFSPSNPQGDAKWRPSVVSLFFGVLGTPEWTGAGGTGRRIPAQTDPTGG